MSARDPAGGRAGGTTAKVEVATDVASRAERLHRAALVIDLHADTPSHSLLRPRYDFSRRHRRGHVDLPRLRDGGVDAQFFIAFVSDEYGGRDDAAFRHAMRQVEAVRRMVERTPGIRLATSAADIEAAAADGEVAALIGVEGGHAIGTSLDRLRAFYDLGARYLTLTWNNTNEWADACCSPPRHGGLSPFGRAVIAEMNRLGMLVDLSHVAESTFWAAIETTSAPVIVSHSNARALADHPRNLTDRQLRAITANGGVIGVNFYAAFLDASLAPWCERIQARAEALARRLRRWHHPARARKLAEQWADRRLARLPAVPLDAVVDHIRYMADVAGPAHVALGSDFDGIRVTPRGLEDVSRLPRLTELLVRRGFNDDEIRGILGANFLRVFRSVTA